ncbi:MAG: glycosyltransferase [Desulfococcaceae bacterium]
MRLSIRDAKKITYPHPADIRIHVLDDGRRPAMKALADQEGVNYITRDSNIGFNAGNLQNAMKQTDGDFILICDADKHQPFRFLRTVRIISYAHCIQTAAFPVCRDEIIRPPAKLKNSDGILYESSPAFFF